MKLRRKKRSENKGAPKWMTTYADMVTLILVFFILLFSMSQVNQVKFQVIAESFKNRAIFDFYPSNIDNENPTDQTKIQENGEKNNEFEDPTENPDNMNEGSQGQLDEVQEKIEKFLENNQLQDIVSANRTERGVVLVLEEQLLFETSKAEILGNAEPLLNKVGTLLTNIPNYVKVEGHTDNRQISTFRYPSNWELSGARASSVVRYLLSSTNGIDAQRFTAVAYGETRPVVPNDSPSHWRENRRVEIVILDPEYNN